MNILFLTLVDFDSISERGIYTDLMREFAQHGHVVHAISPVERRTGQATRLIESGNCRILKLRIGSIQKTGAVPKLVSTLSIGRQFAKAVDRHFRQVRFDLVVYATPPVTLCEAVAHVKRRDNARAYLLLKDIFPQNAVDLGMMSPTGVTSLLYRYFRAKEKALYALSDYIGCMSQANVDYLLKHNPEIPADIVEVCPNSLEPVAVVRNADTVKAVREKYGVPLDRTVFVYGGNLGRPQGIDFVVDCLRDNSSSQKAFFLVVGSGTEFAKIERFVLDERPPNVRLLGQLPRSEYEMLVSSCDVGLIFLDRRFTIPNFPSRLLSYMQASVPVLAATDTSTDLGRIIEDGGFGFWCESRELADFRDCVERLCDPDTRSRMGRNGRQYLEDHFTARRSYEIISAHFQVM